MSYICNARIEYSKVIKMSKKIVVIDGCRTPFLKSGTDYMDLMSYELGTYAIKGLLAKIGVDPKDIE